MKGPIYKNFLTPFGFTFGPAEVTRAFWLNGKGGVVQIRTPHDSIDVYITNKGRKIRVFRGQEELK